MRKIDLIIIHCSATPEGKDFRAADIDRWHRQQGFKSIGYHFVVYRDGSVHAGRPIDQQGAHCKGKRHVAWRLLHRWPRCRRQATERHSNRVSKESSQGSANPIEASLPKRRNKRTP